MTVIVAMRETEDAILIAADGEEAEGDALRITNLNKLIRHPSGPIAWGCSGNPTIGEDFSAWVRSYSWPPKDWRTFREQAIEQLSQLNGRQRELVSLSKGRPGKSDTSDCLLVGWLNEPEIYELNDNGKATSYLSSGFHAIGAGKNHAWVAYKTLAKVNGPTPLEKLRLIMEVVVSTAPMCGQPYIIWQVTKESVNCIS